MSARSGKARADHKGTWLWVGERRGVIVKSSLRFSKASGSTKRRAEEIIWRGWVPGLRPTLFYRGTRRSRVETGKNVA